MTRLFLVRHGPTHAKSMVGWSDLPADLSDSAALHRLSAALPEDALVVSSDLSRAADTASAIQGDRA
ncbi:MAG: histidine phosphatase family protein, partial [Phaeobacter gallaeciensis]